MSTVLKHLWRKTLSKSPWTYLQIGFIPKGDISIDAGVMNHAGYVAMIPEFGIENDFRETKKMSNNAPLMVPSKSWMVDSPTTLLVQKLRSQGTPVLA